MASFVRDSLSPELACVLGQGQLVLNECWLRAEAAETRVFSTSAIGRGVGGQSAPHILLEESFLRQDQAGSCGGWSEGPVLVTLHNPELRGSGGGRMWLTAHRLSPC